MITWMMNDIFINTVIIILQITYSLTPGKKVKTHDGCKNARNVWKIGD
jgi:hypothetical protein